MSWETKQISFGNPLGYRAINGMGNRWVVATPAGLIYCFYIAGDADCYYRKSSDGGLTWAAPVKINAAANAHVALSVWFDKWTPGDAGTRIHIVYADTTVDDVLYQYLDTATDTLGGEVSVFAGLSASNPCFLSIAKARGGNIDVVYNIDSGTEEGFARSTDNGASFGARANPGEAVADFFLLFPGNDADNQDMWCIWWDTSANAISLKVYDDSADSWAETAIAAATEPATPTCPNAFGGAMRHSDGHLILAFWNAHLTAAADLQVYDINGAGSITAKTDVMTNNSKVCGVALHVDQANDDLYVFVQGKSDGSETPHTNGRIYRWLSADDAATWGSETLVVDNTWATPNASAECDLGSGSGAPVLPRVHSVWSISSHFIWFSYERTGGGLAAPIKGGLIA